MTKILRKAALLASVLGGVMSVGCVSNRPGVQARYDNYVDPCWPERYNQQSREAVLNPFDIQVGNAQVIDQTVWNYHFEPGTASLNNNGKQRLDYLARRLPTPDSRLYLQTARDLGFDAKDPEKLVVARTELDQKRGQAVLAYMAAQPNGKATRFEIQPIDAFDPGVNSAGPAASVRGLPAQYRSTISGMAGQSLNGAGGQQLTSGASSFQNAPVQQQQGTAPR